MRILWRRKHYHGDIIYDMTSHFIHEDYRGRLSLDWTEGSRTGSLRISNLRMEDECTYFCRVQVSTLRCGMQVWQSINGTQLIITRGESSCPD